VQDNARLDTIREHLFHGLSDYTKSFPDFSIRQKFVMASPRRAQRLLDDIGASLSEEQEILLYIHLPFCSSECVFCNAFPNKTNRDTQDRYVNSLLKEVAIYSDAGLFDGKAARSIYIGGGTPTAFSSGQIGMILDTIASHIQVPYHCSITCEAHPKDLIKNDRLQELSGLGIRRLSIGCQTFDPKVLALCKRSNRRSHVEEVIRNARDLKLSTNIDMMIGLPGQTLEGVRKDLDVLSDISPDSIEYMRHEIVNPLSISIYKRNPDLLVEDDHLFRMVCETQEWMEERGYEQNGHFQSEQYFPYRYHWLREMPFIALGSRSRSFSKTICYDKHEDMSLYLQLLDKRVSPIARYTVLDKSDQMYRSLFLNLQIKKGLELRAFQERFGEQASGVFSDLLGKLTDYGCIEQEEASIRLTRHGRYFVEDVCCFIIDDALARGQYRSEPRRISHSSGGHCQTLDRALDHEY
jgi:oxygen-independent coproporphyrinogen-3 oxidase